MMMHTKIGSLVENSAAFETTLMAPLLAKLSQQGLKDEKFYSATNIILLIIFHNQVFIIYFSF